MSYVTRAWQKDGYWRILGDNLLAAATHHEDLNMQALELSRSDYEDPRQEVSGGTRLKWQSEVRRLISQMAAHTVPYSCTTAGIKLTVLPEVFSPAYFTDSEWFALEIAEFSKGKALLDVGAGTGIIALAAALAGASACATDINPHAVDNARLNFHAHQVHIPTYLGDVYTAVSDDSRFDCIFWNHPFNRGVDPHEDLLSLCGFDYQYNGLQQYFTRARDYLKPGGRLLLGTSTFAEVSLIERMARRADYDMVILRRKLSPLSWGGAAMTELRICELVQRQ